MPTLFSPSYTTVRTHDLHQPPIMTKLHPNQTTMCSSCDMLLKVKDLAEHLKVCSIFS